MIDRYTAAISGVLMAFIAVLLGVHLAQSNQPAAAHEDSEAEGMVMESHDGYQATLITEPAIIEARQPFQLTLDILQADGETAVSEFDEVHTKLLHLILVSEDLGEFLHVHPEYEGDGRFVLDDAELPSAGNYIAFADFTPTGEHQQVVRLALATDKAEAATAKLEAGTTEATSGPLTFSVELPQFLDATVEQTIKFHVTDSETGEPVDTLDEYLGAAGHLVIIDEFGEIYLHTHPAGHDMEGMDGMAMQYGPDLEFLTTFPSMGLYKMWLQVQYKGEIYTAPFVVQSSDLAEAPAETTVESHGGHG
jgi:hypothetical protein